MKCSDFQRRIPEIIKADVPDEELEEVLEHIQNCADCQDELEIYFVLNYGLSDEEDDSKNMNFIERLEETVGLLRKRLSHFVAYDTLVKLVGLCMYTAVAGSFIYVLFQYLL